MEKQNAPNWIHVFVCTNDRKGERPSCADKDAVEIHEKLKAGLKEKCAGKVRVTKSGCLGLCGQGPNILVHPERIHFSKVTLDDLPEIEKEIAKMGDGNGDGPDLIREKQLA